MFMVSFRAAAKVFEMDAGRALLRTAKIKTGSQKYDIFFNENELRCLNSSPVRALNGK